MGRIMVATAVGLVLGGYSAIQDSNLESAAAALRGHVQGMAAGLGSGPCKTGLQTLEGKLRSLSASLAHWRRDIAARAGFDAMKADATTNREGWSAGIAAANASVAAC
jgi:hypothetical protein